MDDVGTVGADGRRNGPDTPQTRLGALVGDIVDLPRSNTTLGGPSYKACGLATVTDQHDGMVAGAGLGLGEGQDDSRITPVSGPIGVVDDPGHAVAPGVLYTAPTIVTR